MKKLSFAILLLMTTSFIAIIGTSTDMNIMSQRAHAQSTSNGIPSPASCPIGSHMYFWNGHECVPTHAAALP